jgi:hypothetical protein
MEIQSQKCTLWPEIVVWDFKIHKVEILGPTPLAELIAAPLSTA